MGQHWLKAFFCRGRDEQCTRLVSPPANGTRGAGTVCLYPGRRELAGGEARSASEGRRSSCRSYRAPLPFAISPPSFRCARSSLCLPGPASAPPAIRLIEGGEAAAGVSFDAHQGLSEPPSVRKLGAPDKSWAGSSYPVSMEPPQSGDWRSS